MFGQQIERGSFGELLLAWAAPQPVRVVPVIGHLFAAVWGSALLAEQLVGSGHRPLKVFLFLLLWLGFYAVAGLASSVAIATAAGWPT